MQYTPTPNRHEDLVDLDSMIDDEPMPDALPEAEKPKKTKRARGPSPLNPKANRAVPNLATWGLMLFVGWIIMPFVAPFFEEQDDPLYLAVMLAAGGFGLGSTLLWRANKSDDDKLYSNIHMFFFLSLALSLGGWIPESLTFLFLGPLLIGFGAGSFLTVLVLACVTPAKRPVVASADDLERAEDHPAAPSGA